MPGASLPDELFTRRRFIQAEPVSLINGGRGVREFSGQVSRPLVGIAYTPRTIRLEPAMGIVTTEISYRLQRRDRRTIGRKIFRRLDPRTLIAAGMEGPESCCM